MEILSDGDLSVYIPGFKKEALLQYHDESPLNINYISFSTFGQNGARWFYDCSFDEYCKLFHLHRVSLKYICILSITANELEQKERKMSKAEELLLELNFNAQNSSLPPNLNEIQFSFQMRSLAYDHASALLRTRIHLLMHWQDNRLKWDANKYGELTSLTHPRLEVWTPQLVVLK